MENFKNVLGAPVGSNGCNRLLKQEAIMIRFSKMKIPQASNCGFDIFLLTTSSPQDHDIIISPN